MNKLKSFFNWNMRDWWSATTSAIVGTIVGIVVTFGVSGYLDQKKHEETQKTILFMILNDIRIYCGKYTKEIEKMEKADSVYMEIMEILFEKPRPVDNKQALIYINYLGNRSFNLSNKTTEKIFSSNMSTWENIENKNIVENIGKCYSVIHNYEDIYNEFANEQFELYDNFYKENFLKDISRVEQFNMLYKKPEVVWFIKKNHTLYLPYLKSSVELIKEQYEKNLELMGISEEELIQVIKNKNNN